MKGGDHDEEENTLIFTQEISKYDRYFNNLKCVGGKLDCITKISELQNRGKAVLIMSNYSKLTNQNLVDAYVNLTACGGHDWNLMMEICDRCDMTQALDYCEESEVESVMNRAIQLLLEGGD